VTVSASSGAVIQVEWLGDVLLWDGLVNSPLITVRTEAWDGRVPHLPDATARAGYPFDQGRPPGFGLAGCRVAVRALQLQGRARRTSAAGVGRGGPLT
jgi:hypothetical protein